MFNLRINTGGQKIDETGQSLMSYDEGVQKVFNQKISDATLNKKIDYFYAPYRKDIKYMMDTDERKQCKFL